MNQSKETANALKRYKDAFQRIVIWWEPFGNRANFINPVERQASSEYWPAIQEMADLAKSYPLLMKHADLDIRRMINNHNFHYSMYQAVMDDIRILASTPTEQQVHCEYEAVCV
jgi:hypothetical protein